MAHPASLLTYCVALILPYALISSCATETKAAAVSRSAFLGPEELEQSAQAQGEESGQ